MLSRFRSLVLRLAGGTELRPADGAVIAALAFIVGIASYLVLQRYLLEHPEAAPFVDQAGLRTLYAIQLRIFLPAWIAILLVGLLARRRCSDNRAIAYVATQFGAANIANGSYFAGFFTDLFPAAMCFAALVVGVLLFEIRIVRAYCLTWFALVLAMTVAEQMGILPYAPLFAESAVEAGRLAPSSLLIGAIAFATLLGAALFLVESTDLLRDRERKLRRANDLIRRYVPGQLAERILAGEHTGAGHPERRKVTLFFSDVVGFTNTADQMEAEDLSALLNEYLSEMAAIADALVPP